MTPRLKNYATITLEQGWVRFPMFDEGHIIGDRLVPSPIEIDFPGGGGQPALFMRIEVLDNVPRLTEYKLTRIENGREIRAKDLEIVKVDDWIETFVAMASSVITKNEDGVLEAEFRAGPEHISQGAKAIGDARKNSRRPVKTSDFEEAAKIYNAQDTKGIEAVMAALNVSRSTAVRRIRKAKELGLIEDDDG